MDDPILYIINNAPDITSVGQIPENGPDLFSMALSFASTKNDLEMALKMLEKGANVHWRGDTALIAAVKNGWIEMVRLLVRHGANVHASDDVGLRLAVRKNNLAMVEALIELRANVHVMDEIAYKWAKESGNREMVQLLCEHGAGPDSPDVSQISSTQQVTREMIDKTLKDYFSEFK